MEIFFADRLRKNYKTEIYFKIEIPIRKFILEYFVLKYILHMLDYLFTVD